MQTFQLNNGVKIPVLGFGVFQIDPTQTEKATLEAIEVGYRHLDTAAIYDNEKEVGNAMKISGVAREDFFLTTKLWLKDFSYEKAKIAFEKSLNLLQTDYVDLYLLHQPIGDLFGAWRALEELYQEGRIKAIGISNFYPERVADFMINTTIKPMVNQVEINPFFQQQTAIDYMKSKGIMPQAWGPFADAKNNIFSNEILSEIGKKYGKTIAQVILRWNFQRGVVSLAKSVRKEKMVENLNFFDFELSADDMAKIQTIDLGKSIIVNHHDPATIEYLSEYTSKKEF